ncbi:MAG: CbiX/SirB N-terminal domain-containing protein [Herminiimonas sp.]|nr:CbiX/SirB N-terminal domain-containing protein [Herminiimonas sp.]
MSETTALILFAHGARDPRWAAPFERLQQVTQAQLPGVAVRLAFLELMTPRLPEVAAALAQAGCSKVTVVPVFLGQGGHVLRDLPLIVAQLKLDHPQLDIRVADAVGENAAVLEAMAQYCIGTVAH